MSLEDKKHIAETVADKLRERIKKGEFGTGGRLPPISQMAQDYETTRPTVYQALALLQGENIVSSKGNSYYAHNTVYVPHIVPPFEEILAHLGISGTVKNVIDPELITMPEDIARLFGVERGLHVIHRYCVQGEVNRPIRLSEYWYPEQLARPYLQQMKDNPSYDTLASIKRDLNITQQLVHDDILSRLPTQQEANLLAISKGSPVQEVRRTNRTLDGQVLMHHLIVYVGTLGTSTYDYKI